MITNLLQNIEIDAALIPGLDPEDLARHHVSVRLSAGEKKIWRKRRPMRPSEWVEKHRVVTMSSRPGKWRNATTPYVAGIMDASFFESVEVTTICAAPQTAKSECANNCIGYAIDRRPGSALYIYPDEQTARENSKDRIADMIESSPRLAEYMTGMDDDVSYMRINLKHMQIYMGWARSAARLANKPLPYVVFDEIDKYPQTAGKKEADPISLGEKRTRTFSAMRKIWKLSSPTIEAGPIWVALTVEAQVIFDYWVVCPLCGCRQIMVFDEDHFKFPADERDPETIKSQRLAWYECEKCHGKWDDTLRDAAVLAGGWRSRSKDEAGRLELEDYLHAHRPINIGFHIPSWLSPFVTISEVCARFLKGSKDKTALKDFMNNDCAEPWKLYAQEREEDNILALADDRPRGVVPGSGQVAALLAAVDTQDDGFWYEIRAFGWGMEKESWGVRDGFATSFEALERILWADEYKDADGNAYLVRLTVQDSGGHRTAEVYDFCRQHRGKILPLKGEKRMNQPFAYSNIEFYPGGNVNKPIPGGIKLLRVNTTYYKNDLSRILQIAPADPGAWHYHREVTEEWARQMVAEYVDEKGDWQVMGQRANHAWDISAYLLAAAEVLGVRFWKLIAEKTSENGEQSSELKDNRNRQGGGRW